MDAWQKHNMLSFPVSSCLLCVWLLEGFLLMACKKKMLCSVSKLSYLLYLTKTPFQATNRIWFTPSSALYCEVSVRLGKLLVTKPSVLGEKKHLSSVLVFNGYSSSFVQKITKTRTAPRREPMREFKSTTILPYVQGKSEPLHGCLKQQDICTVFKSDMTLWSSFVVQPKDTINPAKQGCIVYRIPCKCGKVYIGETRRPMQERIREHDKDDNSPLPRPLPFLNMPMRPATIRFGTKSVYCSRSSLVHT